MNTPPFSEETIQKFIEAWQGDFGETITSDRARAHMNDLRERVNAMHETLQRRSAELGMTIDEFIDLPDDDPRLVKMIEENLRSMSMRDEGTLGM